MSGKSLKCRYRWNSQVTCHHTESVKEVRMISRRGSEIETLLCPEHLKDAKADGFTVLPKSGKKKAVR